MDEAATASAAPSTVARVVTLSGADSRGILGVTFAIVAFVAVASGQMSLRLSAECLGTAQAFKRWSNPLVKLAFQSSVAMALRVLQDEYLPTRQATLYRGETQTHLALLWWEQQVLKLPHLPDARRASAAHLATLQVHRLE